MKMCYLVLVKSLDKLIFLTGSGRKSAKKASGSASTYYNIRQLSLS